MELTNLSLLEASDLIAKRVISCEDLTQAHLDRISLLEPQLNCFITLTAELALDQARGLDDELQNGIYRGALHGIPIALKDLFETRAILTSAGSWFFKDWIPEKDGVIVELLNAAGAVNLGKLNMHEIALGVTNKNPHFGSCHNPWDLQRTPGGSSGGCGSALAAGLCIGSVGSDTGGSIRIPASLSGIVGLKPTFGRVSLRGAVPLSWNLDHPGPMARRVADVAILLQIIAGYDPEDPVSVDMDVPNYQAQLHGNVRGWQIALVDDPFFNKAEQEIIRAVRTAAEVFASLGAQITPVEFPGAYEAARDNGLMVTSDAAAFHQERLAKQPEHFGEDVHKRLAAGAAYTSSEYSQARRNQSLLRRRFEHFFGKYDLLLTPTTPLTAPLLEGPDAVEQAATLTRFTAPFNFSGLPAISLPCGFNSQGMPIGMQLITRSWGEAALLRAAQAYESATDWHLRRPELKD
ncbi:MAG: amidase [Chloroflexota bacterium]|nr:MAG: amidase [Chloroflexota bacterium]